MPGVHQVLPALHRVHQIRLGGGLILTPRRGAALPEHVERTVHADEEHRETLEAPRGVLLNVERHGVGLVEADVDGHVVASPSEGSDGIEELGIESDDVRFEVGSLAAWPQSDARQRCRGGVPHRGVDSMVDPRTGLLCLHGPGDRRLPRSRRSVQDHDASDAGLSRHKNKVRWQ